MVVVKVMVVEVMVERAGLYEGRGALGGRMRGGLNPKERMGRDTEGRRNVHRHLLWLMSTCHL